LEVFVDETICYSMLEIMKLLNLADPRDQILWTRDYKMQIRFLINDDTDQAFQSYDYWKPAGILYPQS